MLNNSFHIGAIICTIAFAINGPVVFGATDPNIFVKKYEEYLEKLTNFSTTSDAVVATTSPNQRPYIHLSNSKIYISGDNFKLEVQSCYGHSSQYNMQREQLSTTRGDITAQVFLGDKPENRSYNVTGFLKGRVSVISSLSESLYFGMENFESVTRQSSPSILPMLKQAELAVSKQDQYYVLTANGKDFKAELWFDTANQGAPTKIIYSKLPEDIHVFGLISMSLEVTEFTTVSGISVPVKMQIQRERAQPKQIIDESGEVQRVVIREPQKYDPEIHVKQVEYIEVTWENTKLESIPDSMFKMEKLFAIPSGTTVHVLDDPDPENQYVWDGDKIVPKNEYVPPLVAEVLVPGTEADFVEDEELKIETETGTNMSRLLDSVVAAKSPNGRAENSESNLSPGWVIAFCAVVLMVLIVCGVKVFRYYKSGS